MRTAGPLTALALVVVVATSCSASEPATSSPLPPSPNAVSVTAEDYRFVHGPVAGAGRTVFQVVNAGRVTHRPAIYRLPDDMPEINAQLHGPERRSLDSPVADVASLEPGQSETFAVDLTPGTRYAVLCLLRNEGEEEVHAFKGMAWEFRPPGAEPTP